MRGRMGDPRQVHVDAPPGDTDAEGTATHVIDNIRPVLLIGGRKEERAGGGASSSVPSRLQRNVPSCPAGYTETSKKESLLGIITTGESEIINITPLVHNQQLYATSY